MWLNYENLREITSKLLKEYVNEDTATDFYNLSPTIGRRRKVPHTNFLNHITTDCALLRGYINNIKDHPEIHLKKESTESTKDENIETLKIITNPIVFIIHGHDELNLRRLKDMVQVRFGLQTTVLKWKPDQSRTLIEKLEEEASPANFAIALLTPDDLVTSENKEYVQPRPNVIFELGWFFGRLGRKNVCIIRQTETNIHSDISGVVRKEFKENVEEITADIEDELKAAGLI